MAVVGNIKAGVRSLNHPYITLLLSTAYTTWGVAGRKRRLSAARRIAWAGGMLYTDSVSLTPLIPVFESPCIPIMEGSCWFRILLWQVWISQSQIRSLASKGSKREVLYTSPCSSASHPHLHSLLYPRVRRSWHMSSIASPKHDVLHRCATCFDVRVRPLLETLGPETSAFQTCGP